MTYELCPSASPDSTKGDVASVLSALGKLMDGLRQQDLALQNAVTQLASTATDMSDELIHIQHIDLITQTHEDLARFLPALAACLEDTKFDHQKLAEKLRLRSLQEQLLGQNGDTAANSTEAGDVSFF